MKTTSETMSATNDEKAHASAPPSPAEFLVRFLRTVDEVTGRRGRPTWTHVKKVQARLGTTNIDAVHAAIRLGDKCRLLNADGDPPASIALTVKGLELAKSSTSAFPFDTKNR